LFSGLLQHLSGCAREGLPAGPAGTDRIASARFLMILAFAQFQSKQKNEKRKTK